MVCPKCCREYIDGVEVCIDCRMKLTNGLTAVPVNGNVKLVHFMTCFSRQEAQSGRTLLAAHDVEAIVSMDEIRGARLWVHREDSQKAIQIFQAKMTAEKESAHH